MPANTGTSEDLAENRTFTEKGVYHISWESFVYLLEGIVLRDRKVPFSEVEAAAESSITSESEISDEAQNRVFPNSESTQNSVLNNLNY